MGLLEIISRVKKSGSSLKTLRTLMRSVICFRELKHAALLFDKVLPVAFVGGRGTGRGIDFYFPEHLPSRALLSLVYDDPKLIGQESASELWNILEGWEAFIKSVRPYDKPSKLSSTKDDYQTLYESYLNNATLDGQRPIRSHFQQYALSLGIKNADILLPSGNADTLNQEDHPVITLAGIDLIDTNAASWEQIIELRSDRKARLKLQRLRAFLTRNYAGRTRSYIEDDLANAIDHYDQARRKHGFETAVSSISVLLDSRNIHAAISAGLGAALFGGPWIGLSSAVAVEVGKVAIEVSKRRRTLIDWQSSHELAYLIELEQRFK